MVYHFIIFNYYHNFYKKLVIYFFENSIAQQTNPSRVGNEPSRAEPEFDTVQTLLDSIELGSWLNSIKMSLILRFKINSLKTHRAEAQANLFRYKSYFLIINI